MNKSICRAYNVFNYLINSDLLVSIGSFIVSRSGIIVKH